MFLDILLVEMAVFAFLFGWRGPDSLVGEGNRSGHERLCSYGCACKLPAVL